MLKPLLNQPRLATDAGLMTLTLSHWLESAERVFFVHAIITFIGILRTPDSSVTPKGVFTRMQHISNCFDVLVTPARAGEA